MTSKREVDDVPMSERALATLTFHVGSAALCAHDHVFDGSKNPGCPTCGTRHWAFLSRFGLAPLTS